MSNWFIDNIITAIDSSKFLDNHFFNQTVFIIPITSFQVRKKLNLLHYINSKFLFSD